MLNRLVLTAAVSGASGSLASTAVLMALGRAEGVGVWRATNATSHWLHGAAATRFGGLDGAHTAVGYATHHAATTFWAFGYAGWAASQERLPASTALAGALATALVAAAVDYGATPKRFTPGWEDVLTRRSMAGAYLAMALGLAAGLVLVRGPAAARP